MPLDELFSSEEAFVKRQELGPGAVLLRSFAAPEAAAIVSEIDRISALAPFRHMVTPGGKTMSVAMTNCGQLGWVTDRNGYRYDPRDPDSGRPWPPMPELFTTLAMRAADEAGFNSFRPNACLINRYQPGARLSLHQDRDEGDFSHPIVSISLGLSATFLFGGANRSDKTRRIKMESGDIAVWGGPSRLNFHGIAPLAVGLHPLLGHCRINLTFRKVAA